MRNSFTFATDLNINTGHRTITGKKIELCLTTRDKVVRRAAKKNKTQKHSVSIGLPWSGFSVYEYFNRQFTYAVFLNPKT